MIRSLTAALLSAALLIPPAVAQAQTSAPPAPQTAPAAPDRAAVEQIIREYLLANPELLIEAMQELEKKQQARRQAGADKALTERKADIFDDPIAPVAGNPQGDVTIVEFFDYHCGYCKQVTPVLKKVMAEDKGIRVIFKEMPILSDNSRFAALAALASARQGKYLEMHNALMENKNQVTRERLTQIAGELKIDSKKLLKDMDDPQLAAHVDRNLDLARALNVTGTPGFLIGRKVVPGAIDYSTMKRLVAEARGG
jgi:protein-disulfide isomerase